MKTAVLFILSFSVFTFILGFVLSIYDYKRHTKISYRIKNTFPYELIYYKGNTYTMYVRGLLLISLISAFGYFILFYFTYAKESLFNWEFGLYLISGILYSIFALFTVMKNMNNIKIHLLMFTILSVFGFVNVVSLCVPGFVYLDQPHRIILSSISIVIALILLAVIVNPKLLSWAKLEEKRDEQGELTYVRPKVFVLALSEWIFIFAMFISMIISYFLFI